MKLQTWKQFLENRDFNQSNDDFDHEPGIGEETQKTIQNAYLKGRAHGSLSPSPDVTEDKYPDNWESYSPREKTAFKNGFSDASYENKSKRVRKQAGYPN